MIGQITANDLKVKGISAIDELVTDNSGVVITIRGREKYVILSISEYNRLREFELDAAIAESQKEIAEGKFHTESVEAHINRIKNV